MLCLLGRNVRWLASCPPRTTRQQPRCLAVRLLSSSSSRSNSGDKDKANKHVSNYNGDRPAPSHSEKTKELKDLLAELYGEQEAKQTLPSAGGLSEYRDEDAPVIYDVEEERILLRQAYEEGRELVLEREQKRPTVRRHAEILQGRGERGVLSVQELTAILQQEKVLDLAVIKIPAERQYADHLIIGTGRNARHLMAVSHLVLRLYKDQRLASDPVPAVEGEETKGKTGWIAMDLGNIVLHLFTQVKRELYDLETLWTVGGNYDDLTREAHRPTALERLMSSSLDEFQPLDVSPSPPAETEAAAEDLSSPAERASRDRAGALR